MCRFYSIMIFTVIMVLTMHLYGQSDQKQKDKEKAQKELQKAAKESNDTVKIALLSKALEYDDTFTEAYVERGKTYTKIDRPDRAIVDYSKALQTADTCVAAYFLRGSAYRPMGLYSLAREEYNHALSLRPGDPEILQELAAIADSLDKEF